MTLSDCEEQNKNMKAKADLTRVQTVAPAQLAGTAGHGEIRVAGPVRLARGRVHEVRGDGADIFVLTAAAAATGPLFWIGTAREINTLAPTGLQGFVDPARLVLTVGLTRAETLWAGEQALRSRAAPCVIVELQDGPDLKESRRLQIAAEESGAIGLVILHGRAKTSAAETRWTCEAAAGGGWVWICTKAKRGTPGAWRVSALGKHHAPDLVPLAASATA